MLSVNGSNRHLSAVMVAILGAACTAAVTAHAETIYRSIGSDGEVTYSARPLPGAREQTAIDSETLSPEERRASLLLRRAQSKIAADVAAQLKSRENQWRQVDREIVDAQKALATAETALQNGRTPRPGERRGDVGGGSRLSEAYFRRLRDLETQVKKAKVPLDVAYSQRDALR